MAKDCSRQAFVSGASVLPMRFLPSPQQADQKTWQEAFAESADTVRTDKGASRRYTAYDLNRARQSRPVLLSTLCPERWCVAWGVDVGSSEASATDLGVVIGSNSFCGFELHASQVRGVRILHHELVNLPQKALADLASLRRGQETSHSMLSPYGCCFIPAVAFSIEGWFCLFPNLLFGQAPPVLEAC